MFLQFLSPLNSINVTEINWDDLDSNHELWLQVNMRYVYMWKFVAYAHVAVSRGHTALLAQIYVIHKH